MGKATPVIVDGVEIGTTVRTARGTYEGYLLTGGGLGYLPINPGNRPEFSQEEHAAEAVIDEHRRTRR